jgi:cytochrome c
MKKSLVSIAFIALIVSCNNKGDSNKTTAPSQNSTVQATDVSENPDYQKGLELITKSDCLTCHKVDEKLIGPSYRDIANKYESNEDNIKMLSEKIVKGGSGVWGDVPMAAHPQITEQDAVQMVKYIMLLKK